MLYNENKCLKIKDLEGKTQSHVWERAGDLLEVGAGEGDGGGRGVKVEGGELAAQPSEVLEAALLGYLLAAALVLGDLKQESSKLKSKITAFQIIYQ